MKRSRFRPSWIKCSHATELPNGDKLFCSLPPKHDGVHKGKHFDMVLTWGTQEPNKRWR